MSGIGDRSPDDAAGRELREVRARLDRLHEDVDRLASARGGELQGLLDRLTRERGRNDRLREDAQRLRAEVAGLQADNEELRRQLLESSPQPDDGPASASRLAARAKALEASERRLRAALARERDARRQALDSEAFRVGRRLVQVARFLLPGQTPGPPPPTLEPGAALVAGLVRPAAEPATAAGAAAGDGPRQRARPERDRDQPERAGPPDPLPIPVGRHGDAAHAATMTPTVLVCLGLGAERLADVVGRVARLQLATAAFRPLFVVDEPAFALFRRHGYAAEYVVARDDWLRRPRRQEWQDHVRERLAEIAEAYRPASTVVVGDCPASSPIDATVLGAVLTAGAPPGATG